MAKEKPAATVIDYITVVLSPALIMGLVGSLVFFLLEVLYKADGEFKQRLQWVLFFYVFGIVLVGRASMDGETASRSTLYGLALALLTYIGMQTFVKYPPEVRAFSFLANLVLVGVVWWCSHRLVWDCTHVDDDAEAPAEGLMQAAGFEGKMPDAPPETDEQGRPLSWAERYSRWRDKYSRAHVLGVWVVYFSLAALPIFGLGQALVPVADTARRQFTFWLMTVYIACGLGLLLTTCFLGLRRYLRQRGARMPANMTFAWVATGAGLLIALLLLGAVLPRPYSEVWFSGQAGSEKQKASQYAQKGDSPVKDRGKPGEAKKDGQEPGDRSEKDGKGKGKDRGEKGEKDGQKGKGDKDSKKDDSGGDKKEGEKKDGDQQGDSKQIPDLHPSLSWLNQIAPFLKWIVFAVLILIAGFVVIRQVIAYLANFTDWAKRWQDWWNKLWAWWFGGRQEEAGEGGQGETPAPDAPFAAYANPFDAGRAERMGPRELLRYTLAAFEAWARERGVARRDDETAQEYLSRVGDEYPVIEAEGRRFVLLYGRCEYGDGKVPASALDTVRAFWRLMEGSARVPTTATS